MHEQKVDQKLLSWLANTAIVNYWYKHRKTYDNINEIEETAINETISLSVPYSDNKYG